MQRVVARGDGRRRRRLRHQLRRHRTAAPTASRCRAASPTAAELEALLGDDGATVGRGVVSVAPGEQCNIGDIYELQPQVGVPFT